MTFRIRYRPYGQHAHCALFAAQGPGRTFTLLGTFRVRIEEMDELQAAMSGVHFLHDGFSETDPPAGGENPVPPP